MNMTAMRLGDREEAPLTSTDSKLSPKDSPAVKPSASRCSVMAASCCAPGCESRNTVDCKLTFHTFPKAPELQKRWITVTGSKKEKCFDRTGQTTRLRTGALPIIWNYVPWKKRNTKLPFLPVPLEEILESTCEPNVSSQDTRQHQGLRGAVVSTLGSQLREPRFDSRAEWNNVGVFSNALRPCPPSSEWVPGGEAKGQRLSLPLRAVRAAPRPLLAEGGHHMRVGGHTATVHDLTPKSGYQLSGVDTEVDSLQHRDSRKRRHRKHSYGGGGGGGGRFKISVTSESCHWKLPRSCVGASHSTYNLTQDCTRLSCMTSYTKIEPACNLKIKYGSPKPRRHRSLADLRAFSRLGMDATSSAVKGIAVTPIIHFVMVTFV
ncbi:uncharacterized protein LOC126992283 [Eriocheir sinensis]|uniref:uncharacterized protein LOC126992283 n=1 Tax=Eriocheir sinensis TaxID=95602 RepID=UPI0021C7F692|nr:uncharacterized protein LOC126992283 [Eriocheir sinensis]